MHNAHAFHTGNGECKMVSHVIKYIHRALKPTHDSEERRTAVYRRAVEKQNIADQRRVEGSGPAGAKTVFQVGEQNRPGLPGGATRGGGIRPKPARKFGVFYTPGEQQQHIEEAWYSNFGTKVLPSLL